MPFPKGCDRLIRAVAQGSPCSPMRKARCEWLPTNNLVGKFFVFLCYLLVMPFGCSHLPRQKVSSFFAMKACFSPFLQLVLRDFATFCQSWVLFVSTLVCRVLIYDTTIPLYLPFVKIIIHFFCKFCKVERLLNDLLNKHCQTSFLRQYKRKFSTT